MTAKRIILILTALCLTLLRGTHADTIPQTSPQPATPLAQPAPPLEPQMVLQQGHKTAYYGHMKVMALSQDGKWLASAAECAPSLIGVDSNLIIWDAQGHIWWRSAAVPYIEDLQWSPDGSVLAIGDICGVNIFDRKQTRIIASITFRGTNPETDDDVQRVRFLADGERVVLWKEDGSLLVWNWKTGAQTPVYRSEKGCYPTFEPSPDGHWLAFSATGGNERGSVAVFALDGSTPMRRFTYELKEDEADRTLAPEALAWSPNSQWIGGFDDRGRFALWDVMTGKVKQAVDPGPTWYGTSQFALDDTGQVVWRLTGDKSGAYLERHDADGPIVQVRPGLSAYGQSSYIDALLPDASQGAGQDAAGNVVWCDGVTGKVVWSGQELSQWANSLVFSPDGRDLAIGYGRLNVNGSQGEVAVFDAHTGQLKGSFITHHNERAEETGVNAVAYSPDGHYLLSDGVTPDGGATLRLWDAQTFASVRTIVLPSPRLVRIAFGQDGKSLVCGAREGKVLLWKDFSRLVSQGAAPSWMRDTMPGVSDEWNYVMSVAVTPDRSRVLAGGEPAPSEEKSQPVLRVYGYKSGKLRQTLSAIRGTVYGIAFSHDGQTFWTSDTKGGIFEWDTRTLRRKRVLRAKGTSCHSLALSPDEKWLAVVIHKEVALYSLADGKLTNTLRGPLEDINQVAISPNGRLVAACDESGQTTVWNAHTGEIAVRIDRLRVWSDAKGTLYTRTATSTPNGHVLLSPGSENLVRWRVGDELLDTATLLQREGTPRVEGTTIAQALNP